VNDYERIARVIRYLDDSHVEQPDLSTLSKHVGLSPFHFHRLFTTWAGITPKDFLQCLTQSHARELLRQGKSLLDVAMDTGLSGPGRLHDLCVNLESASPGEVKSGGEGWIIEVGVANSPFGQCLIGQSPRGICHFSFVDSDNPAAALAALQEDWPNARLHRDDSMATRLSTRIFKSNGNARSQIPLRVLVHGTAFQVRVWQALLKIPPGTLVSYGRLAAALNQPAAARAVGSAVSKNSLAYLIPCHRVIRETGIIGDYRWGAVRKRALVAWESSRTANGH
jgi:AraC family transcriptional regulator of adaptative response/methylated-DNA-[protein]-cysteine methyltransferase